MIYGALKILCQFEARYNRNVFTPISSPNDSPQSAVYSDLASMGQFIQANAATQLTMSLIKTSLDHYAEDLFDIQSRDSGNKIGGIKM